MYSGSTSHNARMINNYPPQVMDRSMQQTQQNQQPTNSDQPQYQNNIHHMLPGNMEQQHGYQHQNQSFTQNYPVAMAMQQQPMNNQMYRNPNIANMIRFQRPQTRWQMTSQPNFNTAAIGYNQNQTTTYQTIPELSTEYNTNQQQIPFSNGQHPMHPFQPIQNRRMSSSSQHSDTSASSAMSGHRNEGNWQSSTLRPTLPLTQTPLSTYLPTSNQNTHNLPTSYISQNPISVNGQREGNNAKMPPASSLSSASFSTTSILQEPTRPFDTARFRKPRPPPLMVGVPIDQLPPYGYMGHLPGYVAETKGNDLEDESIGATAKRQNYELWNPFSNGAMEKSKRERQKAAQAHLEKKTSEEYTGLLKLGSPKSRDCSKLHQQSTSRGWF